MGLPNPPMDEFAPWPPLCRNCILEVDTDGYCSSCGRLVPPAALTLQVINGGRDDQKDSL